LVYAPAAGGSVPARSEYIPSRSREGGRLQRTERENRNPGLTAPALVPYEDVYGRYRDRAAEALRRQAVPASLREYVKQYFAQLEPQ